MEILNYLWIGIVFVTMISILVAAHELGHYLFARLFGMGCEEFAIGFGKRPLFRWMRREYTLPLAPGEDPRLDAANGGGALEGGEMPAERELVEEGGRRYLKEATVFTVRPWPLGGFVRIKGMMPEEDGGETRIPGGFYSKAPWKRLVVLFAGPLFSVLAGLMLLIPVYMAFGSNRPVERPVIGFVVPKSPAEIAGLKEGDLVRSIDGKPVERFYDLLVVVRESAGRDLKLVYERGGATRSTVVTPMMDPFPTNIVGPDMVPTPDLKQQGKIGAAWKIEKVRLPLGEAVEESLRAPVMVVQGLMKLVERPQRFSQSVSGPITMVQTTSLALQLGVDYILWLAAMISISVGIFNLLPIPPLDGGQMVVAFAELLRGGRRLSLKMQAAANMVGFFLVFSLMIGAIMADVKRVWEAPRKEKAFERALDDNAARKKAE